MASAVCLRCLARPTSATTVPQSLISLRSRGNAFSTSAPLAAKPKVAIPKKKAVNPTKGPRKSPGAFVFARKGGKAASGGSARRDPAALRAMRKRIVLSNTNALEVPGLQELTTDNVLDQSEGAKILKLSNDSIDALRADDAFKHTQGWNMFRQPSTLVTDDTKELARIIADITTNKGVRREVITGQKSSGKSVLALQAMAFAHEKGWIVINVPEGKPFPSYPPTFTKPLPAQDLTQGHTSYAPVRTPTGILYSQPDYLCLLLSRIAKSNASVLSTLTLSQKHTLPIPLQPNLSLSSLASLATSDPSLSAPIFTALTSELLAPSRPPLLLVLDGLPHIMRPSSYLATDTSPIHAHDLALVRTFVDFLSGASPLPNGGVVLGVDSARNRPASPALDQALTVALEAQMHAAERGKGEARNAFLNPHVPFDGRVQAAMQGVVVRRLQGLRRGECAALMEYYARSGILRGQVDERRVGEEWTLAGGGVVGELERGVAMLRV